MEHAGTSRVGGRCSHHSREQLTQDPWCRIACSCQWKGTCRCLCALGDVLSPLSQALNYPLPGRHPAQVKTDARSLEFSGGKQI